MTKKLSPDLLSSHVVSEWVANKLFSETLSGYKLQAGGNLIDRPPQVTVVQTEQKEHKTLGKRVIISATRRGL